MSLRTAIQQAIQAGMNAMGDIQETSTYTNVTANTYNATTGVSTPTKTSYTGVKIVFDRYSVLEIDGDAVRPEDLKALVAKRNLTPTPSLNDYITRGDGTVWVVVAVATDPVTAMWELQIRRP